MLSVLDRLPFDIVQKVGDSAYVVIAGILLVLFGYLIKGIMGAIIAILIGAVLLYSFEGFFPF